MSSLRDELIGARPGIPAFRLALPPGWSVRRTDEATETALLAAADQRLRQAHRPDVSAVLAEQVAVSLEAARSQGAFAMMFAGDEAPEWAAVPISVLVSEARSTAEVPLDSLVADAIERRGARPLDGGARMLRWEDQRTVRLSGESARAHTIVYLTPVPGTSRSRAVQFTATFVHALELDPRTDPAMGAWIAMMDACLASFVWVPE